MDTAEFLARVLPQQGYYSIITINDDDPRQRFVDDIDTMASTLLRLSERGDNVYYAVSSFRDTTSRRQKNVLLTKALYLDVDCGPDKPFPDWKAGLRALRDFLISNNLPKPLIVFSGNGLHVYWTFDDALAPEDWQPLANRLKSLMPRDPNTGQTMFDPAVPADSARVLRAPGTINPKGGNHVRVLLDAPDVTVNEMRAALGNPPPRVVQAPRSSVLASMAVKQDYPPANPDTVEQKCAQVMWAVGHQKDVQEPLWYALLGVAAFCDNPEDTARLWSRDHPGYDETKTLTKLAQWRARATGPTTCTKFEELRPDGCKKCPLKGHITSPAGLGLQYQETGAAPDAPDEGIDLIPLPRGFKRSDGKMVRSIDGTDVVISGFEIYPLGYGKDESLGYETVRYRWKRPHVGWQTLTFRQAFLPDHAAREFATSIADQGIVLAGGKKHTEIFQHMLRAYMEELRQLRSVTNLYSTMGWKDSNTQFLIGETLIRQKADGSITHDNASTSSTIQRTTDAMFGVMGEAQEWAAFTALLERARMPVHMFALCVSFSAPLYNFTGLKGLTISLYGQTGAGKTLAQMWQQSIWGDPTKLHFTAKFTQNALFARMGLYNNLPVTIDETTMLPAKEVGDFLYWVTQGRDKARLTRAAEERDHKTWATVVITSANRSMASMLAASGMETDAQMARLLEITINPHPLFVNSTDAGKRIYEFITSHYGAVGQVFLDKLVSMGEAGIRAALADHRTRFFKKYNCEFSGNERYWEQGIILADFAGELAASLGLIQFDYTIGIKHVLMQIGAMRKAVLENSTDSFDIIAEYLNVHAGQTIQVVHNGNPKPFVDENRLPRGEVHVRYDLYGPRGSTAGPFDSGTVTLDRRHFKQWVANRGADYRTIVRDITDQGANVTPASEKAYLGKDTSIKIGQQYVLSINLKHARLEGILRDMDTAATASALDAVSKVIPMRRP